MDTSARSEKPRGSAAWRSGRPTRSSINLDDAEAGATDRQTADNQATDGERANRDRSDI